MFVEDTWLRFQGLVRRNRRYIVSGSAMACYSS